jgi:hypothetical protein
MLNSAQRASAKTQAILVELAGERAARADGSRFPDDVYSVVTSALQSRYGKARSKLLAFHMLDWNSDAAFIVALLLYPDRFENDEIEAGIEMFLTHAAPNHIAPALKMAQERDEA